MQPKVEISHHCQGAARARGIAVVIDVLRAFSTACYVAAAGARHIWAVADSAEALRLAHSHPQAVLIGERDGRRIPGFDWGNSPSLLRGADLAGRTVLFTTSNGTLGLAAAQQAEEILTGGFVNAGAVAAYIRGRAPSHVSLVCMGSGGRPAVEDTLCALYLRAAVTAVPMDFGPLRDAILRSAGTARFNAAGCADMPPEDLDLCLTPDRFGFVLRAGPGPDRSVALARIDAQGAMAH